MDTLFHYCSNAAAHSIIKHRSIWLSSLSLSNDTMEGKLLAQLIKEIAKNDSDDREAVTKTVELFTSFEFNFDGLGLSLSEAKDQLSQWRGYADNAQGMSIGFSKDYLIKLSDKINDSLYFNLQKIEYDRDKQIEKIMPIYDAYKRIFLRAIKRERITEEDMQTREGLDLNLFKPLFSQKSDAFSEEKEWRIVSCLPKKTTDNNCLFRTLNDRVIPYRNFELEELEIPCIVEIILGPKNITPIDVMKSLLEQNDFYGVEIIRSNATYR